MSHSDPEIQRRLTSAAPPFSGDVNLDLSAVLNRGRVRRRARAWARSSVAALAAFGISLPVFTAGYVIGSARKPSGTSPEAMESPVAIITQTYGGTVAWTANGDETRLESASGSDVLPAGLQGGLVSPLGVGGGVYAFRDEVSPGKEPVIWHPDGAIVDVDVPRTEHFYLTLPAWSPDGKQLAAELCGFAEAPSGECSVVLISPADGSVRMLTESNSQGLSWSPDGSRIAFISPGRSLSLIDVDSGVIEELLPRGDKYTDLFRPAWSPSGSYVAVNARIDRENVPIVVSLAGQPVGGGLGSQGSPAAVAWLRGTDMLITASLRVGGDQQGGFGTSVAVLAPPDWTPRTILWLDGNIRPDIFVSPDGNAILIQTTDQVAAASPDATGTPYSWTVVEIDQGNLRRWDVTDWLILDWK